MKPAPTSASVAKKTHGDVLIEMEEMLRELNAEIAAFGQTRSMTLEVLRDLIEETSASASGDRDRQ